MKRDRDGAGRSARVLMCGMAALAAAAVATPALAGPDRTTLAVGVLESLKEEMPGLNNLPDDTGDEGFYPRDELKERLGKFLFWDKILSGNLNISCATCHHSLAGTGDGLSLPIGEGGQGLGVTRNTGTDGEEVHERVPRNAPPVWNLGHSSMNVMFHDGRVEPDPSHPSGFRTPAGDQLPPGLDNVLAAQAMFPVTSGTEMAGQPGENPIADAAVAGNLGGPGGVWEQLAWRLQQIPEYVQLFAAAYDDIDDPADITYVHAANAIAAYEAVTFRADNSPFDRFLEGEWGAMSMSQLRGADLFYGRARCSTCHSGTFQTDMDYHAIGMPQIGPGKGHNAPGYSDGRDDFGREAVTGDNDDRYRFRTPPLRNVALSAPYGHDGAYATLEAVVRHHLRARWSLHHYDQSQARLPSRPDLDAQDFVVMNDPARRRQIARRVEIRRVNLSEGEVSDLVSFLHALTDPASLDLRDTVPDRVPSGLPLYE